MIKALQSKKPARLILEKQGKDYTEEKELPEDAKLLKVLKKFKLKNPRLILNGIKNIEPGHGMGFNKNLERLFELPVGEIFQKIQSYKNVQFLIIDGILTKRLLSLLMNLKIKFIACKNKEEELSIPNQIVIHFY